MKMLFCAYPDLLPLNLVYWKIIFSLAVGTMIYIYIYIYMYKDIDEILIITLGRERKGEKTALNVSKSF